MHTQRVTLLEASDHLAELIEAVQRGDEVVIGEEGRPQAKLVAVKPVRHARKLGVYRGKLRMHIDFDAPLPENFWANGSP
jgi:prevent-host-death family protein